MLVRRLITVLIACASSSLTNAQVKVTQQTDKISVEIDGQPDTAFYFGSSITKPYLYPLRAANGVNLSRGWPMDPHPGDRHDHIHHRGVWFAHSDVNGFDFWNSDPSYTNPKMGHITVTKINRVTSGPKSGSIEAELAWQNPDGKEILHETREMTFYAGDPRMIDFDFTLTARENIVFGDEKDGVFGLRIASMLEEPAKDAPPEPVRTGNMTESNACHQEEECWGKRGDWVDMSGQINGKEVGVAILDSPQNPGYPTYWHVRGYGLLAANIFGVKAFTHDSAANGAQTLQSGARMHFRYRLVLHSGDAETAHIASIDNTWRSTQ